MASLQPGIKAERRVGQVGLKNFKRQDAVYNGVNDDTYIII